MLPSRRVYSSPSPHVRFCNTYKHFGMGTFLHVDTIFVFTSQSNFVCFTTATESVTHLPVLIYFCPHSLKFVCRERREGGRRAALYVWKIFSTWLWTVTHELRLIKVGLFEGRNVSLPLFPGLIFPKMVLQILLLPDAVIQSRVGSTSASTVVPLVRPRTSREPELVHPMCCLFAFFPVMY